MPCVCDDNPPIGFPEIWPGVHWCGWCHSAREADGERVDLNIKALADACGPAFSDAEVDEIGKVRL